MRREKGKEKEGKGRAKKGGKGRREEETFKKNLSRRDFPSLGDVSIGGFILIFVVFYIFIVPTVDLSDSKNHRESRETQ